MVRKSKTRKIKAEQTNPIEFRPVNLPPNITPSIPRQEQDEAIERTWYDHRTGGLIGKFRGYKVQGPRDLSS